MAGKSFNSGDHVEKTGGQGKSVAPGTHKMFLRTIEYGVPANKKDVPGEKPYEIRVVLETAPIDGFEGFDKEYGNPSAGKYTGQIADGNIGSWPISTYTSKAGKTYERDDQLFEIVSALAKQFGLDDPSKTVSSIEEYMDFYFKKFMDANLEVVATVAGKKYKNKGGYDAYYLSFPKPWAGKVPFVLPGDEKDLETFDAETHVTVMPPKKGAEGAAPTENFNNSASPDITPPMPEDSEEDDDLPF